MNVQHLNYCRQIRGMCREMLGIPSLPPKRKADLLHIVDLCAISVKFLLPEGGMLLRDGDLRALDDGDELNMPYEFVALEYFYQGDGNNKLARVVLFCRQQEDAIQVKAAIHNAADDTWMIDQDVTIPRRGSVEHARNGEMRRADFMWSAVGPDGVDRTSLRDGYAVFAKVIYSFLNALACSNVKIERSEVSKTHKAMRKKGALPFDDYHILTIEVPAAKQGDGTGHGGSHRSPREHLRRGHIRRYESGLKVWVNATVVNHGVGGKVTKDYRIAA